MNEQRLILDAALQRSVIRGTLTAATGERRTFHGWLELNTALEAMLAPVGHSAPPTGAGPQPYASYATRQQLNDGEA